MPECGAQFLDNDWCDSTDHVEEDCELGRQYREECIRFDIETGYHSHED